MLCCFSTNAKSSSDVLLFFAPWNMRGHISVQILKFLRDQLIWVCPNCETEWLSFFADDPYPWHSTDPFLGHWGDIFWTYPMNASVTSNTSSTIPNPVFRCQARKENSCVLEGWQAMVPIHGARWVIWSIHCTVYPYNVSFTGTKTINHGDLRFFSHKTIHTIIQNTSTYPCDCDPRKIYRCIVVYANITTKFRGDPLGSLCRKGSASWTSQAHISDVVLVGPATMGPEAKGGQRRMEEMEDTEMRGSARLRQWIWPPNASRIWASPSKTRTVINCGRFPTGYRIYRIYRTWIWLCEMGITIFINW